MYYFNDSVTYCFRGWGYRFDLQVLCVYVVLVRFDLERDSFCF